ncbi:MAG: OmpH family outer membrane protein [Candidatus Hydrogenedentes bacterium]|nr:OmpH family outer membrane protein [Candidatus Hydrogenedentota bacterium]
MKRRLAIVLGFACVCATVAILFVSDRASAQGEKPAATGAAPKGKIAVINKKTVFDNYTKRKAEWDKLEAEKAALQKEIDALRVQVNESRSKLREGAETLTEEQKRELVDKATADERAYEDKFRRSQGDIDDKSEKFFSVILDQISTGVREVGNAENFKIILDCDPKAGTPVLYFDPSLDITKKVTDHLNSK